MKIKRIALAIIDTENHKLARLAIRRSLNGLDFNRTLVFSDKPLSDACDFIRINKIRGKDEYNRFVLEELPKYVSEDYCLVIQYDGFVLDPSMWRDQFLNYDYVGAVWPNFPFYKVGNGGFSLRSKKLLEYGAKFAKYRTAGEAEDVFLARTIRPLIESVGGVRFAPESVAADFSFESPGQLKNTFGFHGVLNLPYAYRDNVAEFFEAVSHRMCVERVRELQFGGLYLSSEIRSDFWSLLQAKICEPSSD